MRPKLAQGTHRVIQATDIVDGNGDALTVDGWSVLAYAAAETVGGTVLHVWSTNPSADQGQATATGRTVKVFITPAQSNTWSCERVVVQAFLTSPDATQTERIINRTYDLDRRIAAA